MGSSFADRITNECLNLYNSLPKKGKPVKDKEWTLLSCIVLSIDGVLSVVAMATGTKCLGQSEMSQKGDLVNDSHAEVLCRRCFLRYLYSQISKFKNTGTSEIIIRYNEKNKYEIRPNVKFHFFTSHVPCGDASIIPKSTNGGKRKHEIDGEKTEKRPKVDPCLVEVDANFEDMPNENCSKTGGLCSSENSSVPDWVGQDIHRTGAKCVGGNDPQVAGTAYHTVGAVRTKPGRGDPTLSVSCSDKLARWLYCGLQGALLSLLLSCPLLLHSVVVGGGGPYSREVLERAIIVRTGTPHRPALLRSSLVFPGSRYSLSNIAKPCPSAILWARVDHKPLEVCVEGRRQGATKKCRDNGRLMVCKLELLRTFLFLTEDRYHGMKYSDIKSMAQEYNAVWLQAKTNLGAWTSKPQHLQHFVLY